MITRQPVSPPTSLVALLSGVVDYAGLFPPAALSMRQAAADYAAARAGAAAWMLGRFVLPAARLPELAAERSAHDADPSAWHLSALVGDASDADLAAMAGFNTAGHRAVVDAVECRPAAIEGIEWLADRTAGLLDVYVEVGPQADLVSWMARIAARGLRAKIRTGGVTADAFPQPAAVVAFLAAALEAGVPFKATAGLHHAVGGSYRLTYDEHAPHAPMYGYLNLLLAAAALLAGHPPSRAEQVLLAADAGALSFTDRAIHWEGLTFETPLLHEVREKHLIGFGSCSFAEPTGEIHALVGADG